MNGKLVVNIARTKLISINISTRKNKQSLLEEVSFAIFVIFRCKKTF